MEALNTYRTNQVQFVNVATCESSPPSKVSRPISVTFPDPAGKEGNEKQDGEKGEDENKEDGEGVGEKEVAEMMQTSELKSKTMAAALPRGRTRDVARRGQSLSLPF